MGKGLPYLAISVIGERVTVCLLLVVVVGRIPLVLTVGGWGLILPVGKFKGYNGTNTQFSLDDLMDLLHTVDHHKVVNSNDGAVFSDEALAALLDRNFNTEIVQDQHQPPGTTDLFKVLEESGSSDHLAGVVNG